MGNSQFNSSKDAGDGSREDGGFGGYAETRTTPGPSGFAPALQVGDRSAYTAADASMSGGSEFGVRSGLGGEIGRGRGGSGDDMDVESKTDDGDEEEVRRYLCSRSLFWFFFLCEAFLVLAPVAGKMMSESYNIFRGRGRSAHKRRL